MAIDTTIQPIADATTVKEGIGNNLLGDVFGAANSLLGAFTDAKKESETNSFISDFIQRQNGVVGALDQRVNGMTSTMARTQLRLNYNTAIANNPSMLEEINAAYDDVLRRAGIGQVGQSLTPEERRREDTVNNMSGDGYNIDGMSPEDQNIAINDYEAAARARNELEAITATINLEQARGTLDAQRQSVLNRELEDAVANTIRAESKNRYNDTSARMQALMEASLLDLPQAIEDLAIEKQMFEQELSQLALQEGVDPNMLDAFRMPFDSLFALTEKVMSGELERGAIDDSIDNITATNRLLLSANKEVMALLALTDMGLTIAADYDLVKSITTMQLLTSNLTTGADGLPVQVVPTSPEQTLEVTEYYRTITDWLDEFENGDLTEDERLEIGNNVTAVLKGVDKFSKFYEEDPTIAASMVDFLSSNQFKDYVSAGYLAQVDIDNALSALDVVYTDTVEPLIREKFLDLNITTINGQPFTFAGSTIGGGVANDPEAVSGMIDVIITSEGINFVSVNQSGSTNFANETNNTTISNEVKKLNAEVAPAINQWVKSLAHLSGQSYEDVLGNVMESLVPSDSEGPSLEDLIQRLSFSSDSLPEGVADDQQFLQGLDTVSTNLGIEPSQLLAVMDFETGGSFDPSQRNAGGSSATGLIQFMEATAESLGTTTEDLAAMDRSEQLVFVEQYLSGVIGNRTNISTSDLYMSVLWPRAVGKADSYVLWESGSRQYTANAGLDRNGDGTITKAEASRSVVSREDKYKSGGSTQPAPREFATEEEADAATAAGEVSIGDIIFIGGKRFEVEGI